MTQPLEIDFAPLEPFEPAPPATSLPELLRAVAHRVQRRFSGRAIAVFEDGTPCLPEMKGAVMWSGWGAWFLECERAGTAVSVRDRCEGEQLIAAAFERRRRLAGYPKTRYLSRDETLTALQEALGYAGHWGRS